MPAARRALLVMAAVLVLYAGLVTTHAGEFWPFSVYPMFSRAGQPWQRVLVRELAPADTLRWRAPIHGEGLPGKPFALKPAGIRFYDLTELVGKTTDWDASRRRALRILFRDVPDTRPLLLLRARGMLEGDRVRVVYAPFALLSGEHVRLAPALPTGGLVPPGSVPTR